MRKTRFVILNAPVLVPGMTLVTVKDEIHPLALKEFIQVMRQHEDEFEVVSYVGHVTTADLIGVEFNRAEYVPQDGDIAFVVRLRRRVAGDLYDISVNDLQIFYGFYVSSQFIFNLTHYHDPFAFKVERWEKYLTKLNMWYKGKIAIKPTWENPNTE